MQEKLQKFFRDVGSLYDFGSDEAPEIPERSCLHYLSTAFEYIGNGLETSSAETQGKRAEKSGKIELLGIGES